MKLNQTDLDSLSLEQALLDVEVAQQRVLDLTARVVSMNKELLELRSCVEADRSSARDLEEKRYILKQLSASRSLKLMSRLSRPLRSALEQAAAAAEK